MRNYFLISIFSVLSVFLIGCLDNGEETSDMDTPEEILTYKVISSIDCEDGVYTLSMSVKESAVTEKFAYRFENPSKELLCFTKSSAFCQKKFDKMKTKDGCKEVLVDNTEVLVDNTESTS